MDIKQYVTGTFIGEEGVILTLIDGSKHILTNNPLSKHELRAYIQERLINVSVLKDSELMSIYKYICPRCKYPLMRDRRDGQDDVECVNANCDYSPSYNEDKYKGIPEVKDISY